MGLEPTELTDTEVCRFLRGRRQAAPTGRWTEREASLMLDYLRRLGVVPEPEVAPPEGPSERLLERYRDYLVRERGLVATTVVQYLEVARSSLIGRMSPEGLDLASLGGADVTGF